MSSYLPILPFSPVADFAGHAVLVGVVPVHPQITIALVSHAQIGGWLQLDWCGHRRHRIYRRHTSVVGGGVYLLEYLSVFSMYDRF